MRGYVIKVWHFEDETGGGQFANAWNRSDNIHRFLMLGTDLFNKFGFDGSQFFFQAEESFDASFQNFLSVFVIDADGMMGECDDFLGCNFYFSAFAFGDFFNDFGDFFLSQFSGNSCRGGLQEEFKHGFSEDVISGQFVKDVEGDLFNAVFEFSDFLGDYFVFSAEEFSGVCGGVIFDLVGVFEEEGSDSFCRDFVGSGFSQGTAFFEVFDEQWVEGCDIIALVGEEVKDVNVVAAGGFNTDGEVLRVADGLQVFQDFVKIFFGLGESFLVNDFFLCVKGTEVQGIEGCIYANKIFILRHGVTSFFALGGLKSGNRVLSLSSSKVIRDLSPNQPIGNGESRGHTPCRALCPGIMSSPCFQFLSSISSLIISELYPNST